MGSSRLRALAAGRLERARAQAAPDLRDRLETVTRVWQANLSQPDEETCSEMPPTARMSCMDHVEGADDGGAVSHAAIPAAELGRIGGGETASPPILRV